MSDPAGMRVLVSLWNKEEIQLNAILKNVSPFFIFYLLFFTLVNF